MKSTICLLLLCGSLMVSAQEFPFGTDQWEISARGSVLEMFEGKRSLYLHQGKARLKDFEFFTGTLEYDVYITERRGFPGIQFRVQDDLNYEEFYIRPHQSGNPDANQYTPVFNGNSAWQLYFGNRFSTAYQYPVNRWSHVKLVIAENAMEVYINDMEEPMLYVDELKQKHLLGGLQFQAGGPSGFHMANLKVTKATNPSLKGKVASLAKMREGVLKKWSISSPFAEKSLAGVFELTTEQQKGLSWTDLEVEERGYANISRTTALKPGANTVFARVIIESDKKQNKRLFFGASDRGIIYLNGRAITATYNNFRSQDYRHLGTIGFHDVAYLPLKKGKNEIWVAVSENFGGWGVMAAFEDPEGLKF